MNETYCVGNVDANGKLLVKTARECLEKSIAMGKWRNQQCNTRYVTELLYLYSETWC
jgi:hypothetical protein